MKAHIIKHPGASKLAAGAVSATLALTGGLVTTALPTFAADAEPAQQASFAQNLENAKSFVKDGGILTVSKTADSAPVSVTPETPDHTTETLDPVGPVQNYSADGS